MNYPDIPQSVEYILIESYHSGTVNTKDAAARNFFAKAMERGVTVFMSGSCDGDQYISTSSFAELSIVPIVGVAPISLYMKLWLYSLDRTVDKELLLQSRGGDIC